MMSEQAAFTFFSNRRKDLNLQIATFRKQMNDEIKRLNDWIGEMPPSALIEAQRLIDSYKVVLKALEGF